jgi:SAM-dependent methyltransferase
LRAAASRTLSASVGRISISDDRRHYWEQVYATRQAEKLGWYKPRLDTSLAWIMALDPDPRAAIIDVGGGASTLVDDLVDEGFESITVLDVADTALQVSRRRLGHQADLVMWLSGDISEYRLPASQFDIWHDRAVLHFLTNPADRDAYVANLRRALKPGGHAIIGLFAPEAPPKCSGLPVQRYDHKALADVLGDAFELLEHRKESHTTPGGVEQMYLYCRFRKSGPP